MKTSALLALAGTAGLLAAGAHAQDVILGSSTTLISKGHPITGPHAVIGACGGSVQSMAVTLGTVVIGTTTGQVYQQTTQGTNFWFQSTNDARSMVGNGAQLFVGGGDGSIVRYDYPSGIPQQTFQPGFSVEALVMHNGKLIAASPFGILMEGDPQTGTFGFFGTCGGQATGMTIEANQLFVTDASGFLWTFDLTTKQLVNSVNLGFVANGAAAFGGDLLVGLTDHTLRRIDRTTGAVKQTTNVFFPIDALLVPPTTEPGFAYCFGSACPCGNDDGENGCVNSTGFGTGFAASGTPSVQLDNLRLTAYDLPANLTTIFYASATPNSVPFGDGLLCAGGGGYPNFRFGVQNSGPEGAVTLGPGIVSYANTNFGAGVIAPGIGMHFQAWYRDPAGPCGATFNTTVGYKVTFDN